MLIWWTVHQITRIEGIMYVLTKDFDEARFNIVDFVGHYRILPAIISSKLGITY